MSHNIEGSSLWCSGGRQAHSLVLRWWGQKITFCQKAFPVEVFFFFFSFLNPRKVKVIKRLSHCWIITMWGQKITFCQKAFPVEFFFFFLNPRKVKVIKTYIVELLAMWSHVQLWIHEPNLMMPRSYNIYIYIYYIYFTKKICAWCQTKSKK